MDRKLPKGFSARPARFADVDVVVELLNICQMEAMGVGSHNPQDQSSEWNEPGFNLECDSRLVFDPTGRLVAYQEVFDPSEPHVRIFTWGQVHPEFTGLGIGSDQIDWAEQRARLSMHKAPQDARVSLHGFILSTHTKGLELYKACGFELSRYSLRMMIDLGEPPTPPDWPEGIAVRTMVVGQDERSVAMTVRESFRDHWGFVERPFEADLAQLEHRMNEKDHFDPSLWFLAWDGDQLAGVSLCMAHWFDDPDLGWVSTLGVLRPWRRRGLGMALLRHSFQELYRIGRRKVGLGVDSESLTGATRLYEKAGMHSDPNRQFAQFVKVLRPGVDLSTQTV